MDKYVKRISIIATEELLEIWQLRSNGCRTGRDLVMKCEDFIDVVVYPNLYLVCISFNGRLCSLFLVTLSITVIISGTGAGTGAKQ